MQIIMSPAKLMDFNEEVNNGGATNPVFSDKTNILVDECKLMSHEVIMQKMQVNAQIARQVYEFYQTFSFPSTPQQAASLAYNGIAYKGLNAHDFDEKDKTYAQNHLNIISALYGVLKPFDLIKPYRLEFSRKIMPDGYKNLYDFWKESINGYLSGKMEKDNKVIVNVASHEYSKVLQRDLLPTATRVIEINFLQQQNNDLKQIVVHTKKARGLMSRFIIKNKLVDVEDIKAFDYENYFFYPSLSTDSKWYFVR